MKKSALRARQPMALRAGLRITLCAALCSVVCILICTGCGAAHSGNMPYEPDTPAPAPHDGVFVSEHGTMTFNGDGQSVITDFDAELSTLIGLPEGEQEGTYVFLSGDLPPHGSMEVRYDTAHELRITINETSAVIDVGIAAEDGSAGYVGTDIVTPEMIPMLFRDENYYDIRFLKQQ